MAMWELYNRGEGTVAIKSTVERLKEILQPRKVMSCIGKVDYIHRPTYAEPEMGQSIIFRKDLSYSFENEVRAVILDPNEWGYQRGVSTDGEAWSQRVTKEIEQLYQRVGYVTAADLESPELTRILDDGFAPSADNAYFETAIDMGGFDLSRLIN